MNINPYNNQSYQVQSSDAASKVIYKMLNECRTPDKDYAVATPEQFDRICNEFPEYQIGEGDEFQRTALMWACRRGSPELVEHIAKKSIGQLNLRDGDGKTALYLLVNKISEAGPNSEKVKDLTNKAKILVN